MMVWCPCGVKQWLNFTKRDIYETQYLKYVEYFVFRRLTTAPPWQCSFSVLRVFCLIEVTYWILNLTHSLQSKWSHKYPSKALLLPTTFSSSKNCLIWTDTKTGPFSFHCARWWTSRLVFHIHIISNKWYDRLKMILYIENDSVCVLTRCEYEHMSWTSRGSGCENKMI